MTRLWGFNGDQERSQEQHNTRAQLPVLFRGERRGACLPRALLLSLRKLQNGFWEENLDASHSVVRTCRCLSSWPQPSLWAEQVSHCSLEVEVLEHTGWTMLVGMWYGGRTSPSKVLPVVCQLPTQNPPWSIAISAVGQLLKRIKLHFIASFFMAWNKEAIGVP